ncbi:hypothetical protein RclHR1_27260002 [Rhizophagus clarus]|uniref:Uncharacterized protein n=1 Tax=Rhizophagus clarus TaxID=94130 RepID=A0A2Z6R1U2_9GLOM|nr:hypothetical protein RclHR1_27260002 [Rhizophagus clarus]
MELCFDPDVIGKKFERIQMQLFMEPNMLKITLQLANLCLTTGDIPADWPITLLETMRKAVVKIVTQKLSHIIANNNILKGGNHSALPGGSTEIP